MRYNILTYHIGEGIRNLFKNKKSTIASLCIMMATMLMFGIFFIIGENINHIMETIEEDQGMQVFIIDEASSKEVQEVRDMISSIDGVASATIYTKQDALDEMKVRLKNNQDVLAGYDEDNNIFPDSVIVKLTDLQKSAEVQEKIRNIVIIVFINLLIEYFIYSLVFFQGPNSWRKYEYEGTKIYYSSEKIEISPMTTFVFEEEKEEKQYIVVEYEEKIKLTDKAPLKKLFDFLNIEVKTGKVEYHITSVY